MNISSQLDGEGWTILLGELSEALGSEGPSVKLCLIGSAACLFGGMDGRTSGDLDVWKPASDFDRRELNGPQKRSGFCSIPNRASSPIDPIFNWSSPEYLSSGILNRFSLSAWEGFSCSGHPLKT